MPYPARRLIAARIALATLVAVLVGGAAVCAHLWLRERRRMQQFAADLVSDDPAKRDRAVTLLLERGSGAVDYLEKAARITPDPVGADCRRLLEHARQPPQSGVLAALRWLARHQEPDGSWNAGGFSANCAGPPCTGPGDKEFTAGVTSLSVLAFLGAGYSHLSRDMYATAERPGSLLHFGRVARKGVDWLLDHQAPDGSIGIEGPKPMVNHAIAALALSEAYGMTAAPSFKAPAQRAIDYLVAAQNPGKGWRYTARSGESDSSVTGWAVMALKSAELSELQFPRSAYDGARAWFEEVTEAGRVGYLKKGDVSPEGREGFDRPPTLDAMAAMSLIFIDKKKSEPVIGAVRRVAADPPLWKAKGVDFMYWYFGALATFQFDGPHGPTWKKWDAPLRNALVPSQKRAIHGCANGSWDPLEDRWGSAGGRVYAVALNAQALEVYYRYANVWGTAASADK